MSEEQKERSRRGIDIRRVGEVPLSGEPQTFREGSTFPRDQYTFTVNRVSVKNYHLLVERENAKHPNWFPYNITYMLDQELLFKGCIKAAGKRLDLELQFGAEGDLEKWKGPK